MGTSPRVFELKQAACTGREASSNLRIAIKKIKVGEFKDGLDMSAIREVQYLRELSHPNVIKVRLSSLTYRSLREGLLFPLNPQLLDVYSSKANLNLVLEYLDSDLEVIIKDRSNVFKPADIKSWVAMTLRGLEFCHRNWILHRVCFRSHCTSASLCISRVRFLGFETEQFAHCLRWATQVGRFWSCTRLCGPWLQNDLPSNYSVRCVLAHIIYVNAHNHLQLVPTARAIIWCTLL